MNYEDITKQISKVNYCSLTPRSVSYRVNRIEKKRNEFVEFLRNEKISLGEWECLRDYIDNLYNYDEFKTL